jgi:hypothetical protein
MIEAAKGYKDTVAQTNSPGSPGVLVDGGGTLLLQHTIVYAGDGLDAATGGYQPTAGGDGVDLLEGSRLFVADCEIHAGKGGQGDPDLFGHGLPNGGSGIEATGAVYVDVAGGVVAGGNNGFNTNTAADAAGDGIHADSASATIRTRSASISAGSLLGSGVAGTSIDAPPGTSKTFPAAKRSLDTGFPVREGQQGFLTITGKPGDHVLLMPALGAGFTPVPAKQGVFMLDSASALTPILIPVLIDAGSTMEIPFIAPELPPGMNGAIIAVQLAIGSSAGTTIEGGATIVWLDSTL